MSHLNIPLSIVLGAAPQQPDSPIFCGPIVGRQCQHCAHFTFVPISQPGHCAHCGAPLSIPNLKPTPFWR